MAFPRFAAKISKGSVLGRRKGARACTHRVIEDLGAPDLRKQQGTIVKRWGIAGHAALDVLLDKGGWELFWYHELEEIDEDEGEARPRRR